MYDRIAEVIEEMELVLQEPGITRDYPELAAYDAVAHALHTLRTRPASAPEVVAEIDYLIAQLEIVGRAIKTGSPDDREIAYNVGDELPDEYPECSPQGRPAYLGYAQSAPPRFGIVESAVGDVATLALAVADPLERGDFLVRAVGWVIRALELAGVENAEQLLCDIMVAR